jgi:hypothetical protein
MIEEMEQSRAGSGRVLQFYGHKELVFKFCVFL